PGTWARKAPETPERPHRQAYIVDCPEKLQLVSREALESLAADYVRERPALEIPTNDQAKLEWLRGFLENYKVPVLEERQNGQRYFLDVVCPWEEEHNSESSQTASSVGYERGWGYSYKCFHSECTKQERGWLEFKNRVIEGNPDLPAYSNVLP